MEAIVGTTISILVPGQIRTEYDKLNNIIISCDNKDIQDVTVYIKDKGAKSWKMYYTWYLKNEAEGKQFYLTHKNANYISDYVGGHFIDSLIFYPNSEYLISIYSLHTSAEIYLYTNNIGVVDSVKNDNCCDC